MRPPLWLPVGSVRAILALVLTIADIGLLAVGRIDAARELSPLTTSAIGWYFLTRDKAGAPAA